MSNWWRLVIVWFGKTHPRYRLKPFLMPWKVRKLQGASLRNPVKIESASKYSTVDTLKQYYRLVPATYKLTTSMLHVLGLASKGGHRPIQDFLVKMSVFFLGHYLKLFGLDGLRCHAYLLMSRGLNIIPQ